MKTMSVEEQRYYGTDKDGQVAHKVADVRTNAIMVLLIVLMALALFAKWRKG